MMTKKKTAKIVAGIEKHMAAVAKARDELDEFIGELTSLREDCDEAHDCLQRARDALSELV